MRIAAILTLAGALALAGCDQGSTDDAPIENESVEEPVVAPVETPVVNEAEVTTNSVEELPPVAPPPEFSDQQQIQDDADATGLTARLPEDDDGKGGAEGEGAPIGGTANEAGPVE